MPTRTTPLPGTKRRYARRAETSVLVIAAVAGLTLLGLAIRVANFDQSLFADELSTYWIIHGRSLGSVLSHVRSNDEVTPPLYFVLGWLSLKLGSVAEWVRLPSLLAGTATIPLIYVLGMRTVSRAAGLVGAAVMALSPFMVYYSTEARSYALMIALVTASTLALLAALRGGRARWWVVYAVCSCGALYSHYTSVFPLGAQFVWVLWAHREAWPPLLLANLGVFAGFAPWIPGFIADNNSPTTEILSRLQPFTFDYVRVAIESWTIGYPYVRIGALPGNLATGLIVAGVAVALVAGAIRAFNRLRGARVGVAGSLRRVPSGVALVALLALATPVGEALYSAVGTHVLGARNLNASWPGLSVAVGALVTAGGLPLSVVCGALVLSGFAIGAAKTLNGDVDRVDLKDAADLISRRAAPGDVVVDASTLTPVPLTALDVYLPQNRPEFRLGLPMSHHPFMIGDPIPPASRLTAEALRAGKGRSIFLVTPVPGRALLGASVRQESSQRRQQETAGGQVLARARSHYRVTYERSFAGLAEIHVVELRYRGPPR